MKDELWTASVAQVVRVLQNQGIGLDTFNVHLNKDDALKIIFGKPKTKKENSDNMITAHWKKVSVVLGGPSISNFTAGNVEGIAYLGDGECEIDMSTPWIIDAGIEAKDFRSGVEKFYKGKKAANVLRRAQNIICKMAKKHPEYFMKCGRIWLCNKQWIDRQGEFNKERDSLTSKRTTTSHARKLIQAA